VAKRRTQNHADQSAGWGRAGFVRCCARFGVTLPTRCHDALTGAVRFLVQQLRPYEKVFRYGGDEFLIGLPGADLAIGQTVIRRIRDGLEGRSLAGGLDGSALSVTASFGLALLDPEVGVEVSIERADQALLLAKTAGRNRAISWDESVTTSTRIPRPRIEDSEA